MQWLVRLMEFYLGKKAISHGCEFNIVFTVQTLSAGFCIVTIYSPFIQTICLKNAIVFMNKSLNLSPNQLVQKYRLIQDLIKSFYFWTSCWNTQQTSLFKNVDALLTLLVSHWTIYSKINQNTTAMSGSKTWICFWFCLELNTNFLFNWTDT